MNESSQDSNEFALRLVKVNSLSVEGMEDTGDAEFGHGNIRQRIGHS
ncbi:hypothetical protein [Glutamicibacter sp. M10]|nr:hypothetical protein [Glutamicibacter sp. M10]UXN31098.1 hypothetical protein N6V40_11810 [Glutamicibacter sp. M10]